MKQILGLPVTVGPNSNITGYDPFSKPASFICQSTGVARPSGAHNKEQ